MNSNDPLNDPGLINISVLPELVETKYMVVPLIVIEPIQVELFQVDCDVVNVEIPLVTDVLPTAAYL